MLAAWPAHHRKKGRSLSVLFITTTTMLPSGSRNAVVSNVVLSWSNPASYLLLRSTTSLVPPVAWLPLTNTPANQNGVWQLYWTPVDAVRFFRLSAE